MDFLSVVKLVVKNIIRLMPIFLAKKGKKGN